MPSIAFFHGWGFDRNFWGNINLGENWRTYVFDRGYFGTQEMFETLESVDLIVAHSWGLHWIPERLYRSAKGIVLINSFFHFFVENQLERIKQQRMISEMLKGFETDPHQVLSDYYLSVFSPHTVSQEIPEFLHHTLLRYDLTQFEKRTFPIEEVDEECKWLIMQGKKDVLRPISEKNEWQSIKKNIRLKVIESAGHAIWKTHTQESIQSIRLWLKTLF